MKEIKRILYLVVIFSLVAFTVSSSVNPLSDTLEPLIAGKKVNPLQKVDVALVTIFIEHENLVNVSKSTVLNVSIYSYIPADTRYLLEVEVDDVFSHTESIILQSNVWCNRSFTIMFEDTGTYSISASVHSPDYTDYWSNTGFSYNVYTDIYFDIIQDYYEYQNDIINSYTTDIEFAFADFALLNHTWNFEILLDDGLTNTSVFRDINVTMTKYATGYQNLEGYLYPNIGEHEIVTVNFNHTGYYDVWFVAYDVNTSQYYYDWCYYDVYGYDYAYYSEDDWLLVVSQQKEGLVNDDPMTIMFGARFEGDYNASVYFDLIVSNGTVNTTYYSQMHNFTIGQSRWFPSKTLPIYQPISSFTESGYYDVWLLIKNATTNETIRFEYCWFDIYEFLFDFTQDTSVRLYEETYIDYDISLGSFGSSFNCTVDVFLDNGTTNQTLFNNSHEVEVGSSGYDWGWVILNQTGPYQVWFVVNDTTNNQMHYYWCYYIVEESLEIDIYQENYVYANKNTTIGFDIENWAAYYYYNISVELLLDDGITQTTLYKNDSLIIDGNNLGDYDFYHGIEFFFNETGYYDVILRITDLNTSTVWEYYCWYEVEEVFELWIDQDYDAMVGEEEDILFGANWHDYSQKANLSIKLLLDNGTVNTTLYDVSKYSFLNSTDDFFEDRVYFVFNETGYYDVWFIMTDLLTGEIYWDCCWFYVEEIEIYLTQEYFIELGESAYVDFSFDSMYGDSFFDVFVSLIDEAGVEYLIFEQLNFQLEVSSCGMVYSFYGSLDYLFSAAGYYDVLFEIYDVTNGWYWEEWCWFYVYEYDEFDIYFIQEYDVFVDVWTTIYVGLISPVFAVYEVEVLIDDGYTNDSVLYNPYVVLTEEDPGISKDIEYVFRKAGHYKVWLIYTDVFTGEVIVEECYFDVHLRRWEDSIPVVTITGIVNSTTYAGTVNVGVSVTDESKVTNATINIKGTGVDQTYNIILNLAAGTWTGTFALDTTALPDGSYTVTIEVFDEWGNKKTIVFTITIDNPDPTTTAPPTTTVPTTTITTGEVTTTETTIASGPGFELPFVFLSLLAVFVFLKRRK